MAKPTDDLPAELRVRLVFARGVTESMLGRTDESEGRLTEALALAQANKLDRLVAKISLHLGLNQLRVGRLPDARSHLDAALDLSIKGRFVRIQSRTLASMGMAHEAVAEFEQAESCYQKADAIARRVGDSWEEARCRSKMGTLYSFMAGRQDEARGHLCWALERSRAIGDTFIAATSSFNLGRLELNLGKLAEAEEHLCYALTVYRDMANRVSEGFVRMALGLLHLDRGVVDSAIAELELAANVLQAIAHPLAGAFNDVTLAMAHLIDGDPALAKGRGMEAMEQVQARNHLVLEGVSAIVCGLAALKLGENDAVVTFHEQATRCLGDSGWGEGLAMLKVADAMGAAARGEPTDSEKPGRVTFARARVGWRILEGSDARDEPRPSASLAQQTTTPGQQGALIIGAGCKWFQAPGTQPVDLSRKRTLRPMLELLAQFRTSEPGVALDVDQLFEGVWPGERALVEAKKNRVYVSIASLRKMGLADVLTTRGDGYLLDPDVVLERA